MKRRAFMGLGVTSVGVGALYGTGAFSSVNAGRGVSVSAADDESALLGLEGNDDPAITPEFTNNTNYVMSVTLEGNPVEFDIGDGLEDEVTFELSPKDSEEDSTQEVTIGGDDSDATITAVLSEDGTDATKRGTITLERWFVVPQVAAVREVVGSVDEAGNSGKYEFTLTNENDEDVTLDGFGVEDTTPDADEVGGGPGGSDSILEADGTQIVDTIITVGGPVVDVIDGEAVTLDPGEEGSVPFEFIRFREDGDGIGVDDVDLIVRAEDGSSEVVELRADD